MGIKSIKVKDARRIYQVPLGTLVDTNILIDVFIDDPKWASWSIDQLERYASLGQLIINPIILAELSPRFATARDLEHALSALPIRKEQLPWDAAFLAGQAFKVYRKLMGTKLSPMPDFYIGAHAVVQNLRLMTRDTERYTHFFPRLTIISPK